MQCTVVVFATVKDKGLPNEGWQAIDLSAESEGVKLSSSNFIIDQEENLDTTLQILSEEVRGKKLTSVLISPEGTVTESDQDNISSPLSEIRKKTKSWLINHNRVFLSLVRGFSIAGGVTFNLIVQGFSPEIVFPSAISSGLMSGTLQWNIKAYRKHILMKPKTFWGRMLVGWAVNLVYFSIVKLSVLPFAPSPDPTFFKALLGILGAATLTTAVQMPLNINFGLQEEIQLKHHSQNKEWLHFLTDAKMAFLSIAVTVLNVLKINHVPFIDPMLVTLAAVGLVRLKFTTIEAKKCGLQLKNTADPVPHPDQARLFFAFYQKQFV